MIPPNNTKFASHIKSEIQNCLQCLHTTFETVTHTHPHSVSHTNIMLLEHPMQAIIPASFVFFRSYLIEIELAQSRKLTPLQTENFSFCVFLLCRYERTEAATLPQYVAYAPQCYSIVSSRYSFSLAQEIRKSDRV